jgi:hypothetical protein
MKYLVVIGLVPNPSISNKLVKVLLEVVHGRKKRLYNGRQDQGEEEDYNGLPSRPSARSCVSASSSSCRISGNISSTSSSRSPSAFAMSFL